MSSEITHEAIGRVGRDGVDCELGYPRFARRIKLPPLILIVSIALTSGRAQVPSARLGCTPSPARLR